MNVGKRRIILALLISLILILAGGCQNGKSRSGDSSKGSAETTWASKSDAGCDENQCTCEGCKKSSQQESTKQESSPDKADKPLDEDDSYTSKEDVSNYLIQYKRLPNNFITKKEARSMGWKGGSLEKFAPGKCIGGDRFGNYEGLLPDVSGRNYYECDIDTLGAKSRGPKRIVYSDDWNIYYTDDHYKSFTLLYGDD